MKQGIKAVLSGMSTYIPGHHFMRSTGGTSSARYCYSAWLRHLILARQHLPEGKAPTIVAELGPGDSIGIGLAALLSGVEKYYALDVVRYSDLKTNLQIFDELILMFRNREAVPAGNEFSGMNPKLRDYSFPHKLLTDELLNKALEPARIEQIRSSLASVGEIDSRIYYHAPWADPAIIQPQSVDMIFSQAVLEHVTDLSEVYGAMQLWLKPNGIMTHQIDYSCHGKADNWNGHWTYSDQVWKLIVGRRPYLLNRVPHSEHISLLREHGFDVLVETTVQSESRLRPHNLAKRFRTLSEQDLTTSGAFVVCRVAESRRPTKRERGLPE